MYIVQGGPMARSRALAVRVVGHARSFSASRTLSSYTTKADTTDGKYDYDLLVIGSGPAGYAAAVRAWDLGKTVCVVEKDWLGGAGVWNGALSSKTQWQLSRRARGFGELLNSTRSGLKYEGLYDEVRDLVWDAECTKAVQMEVQYEALHKGQFRDSMGRIYGGKITLICGMASLTGPHTASVAVDGRKLIGSKNTPRHPIGFHHISARNILIATGSRPRQLADYPADGKRVLTSDHVTKLDHFPKSLCIIGAGVIGCEYAAIFSNFGQTRVHLVNERRKRLLPTEDPDLSQFISRGYTSQGVIIHNNCKVLGLDVRAHEVEVRLGTIVARPDGTQDLVPQEPFTVESVLVSVGRIPNTEKLNLKAAGVRVQKNGGIETDKRTCQSIDQPHIYAAGDATLDIGLVSVAEMEGRAAVEHMFNAKDPTEISYDNVASIMFLKPEVACVGMNELEARRQRIPHKVAVVGFDVVDRGIINRPQYAKEYLESPSSEDMTGPKSQARRLASQDTRLERSGFVKMIVTGDDDHVLLGMRAAGEDASAIIEAGALLIREKQSIRYFDRVLHPHPAITSSVQECARMILGKSINKPHVFASCWMREYVPSKDETAPHVITGIGLVPSYGTEDRDFEE